MMIGAESTHSPDSDATDWPDAWSQLNGWRRWLTVTGAEHFSFTDLPYLANQLGLSDPAVPLPGARGWLITRDYVTAFCPTTAHPEVVFRDPVWKTSTATVRSGEFHLSPSSATAAS